MHFQGETSSGGNKDKGSNNLTASFQNTHTMLEGFTDYDFIIVNDLTEPIVLVYDIISTTKT
jgi:hypothetical protein